MKIYEIITLSKFSFKQGKMSDNKSALCVKETFTLEIVVHMQEKSFFPET